MPNIYEYAQQFRRDLEAGATDTSLLMIKLYGDLWSTKIKPQLDSVTADIEADIAAGKDPTLARQAKRARMLQLQEDMRAEMLRISAQIQHIANQDIQAAVDRAQLDAFTLMKSGINPPPGHVVGNFNRLPREALENLAGALQPGSPLQRLTLGTLADDAADAVGKALLQGLALGKGPRDIARSARDALGGNMARALTIARTETLRAYREASRQTYAENPRIVKQWMWLCAKTTRTCAVCWASNGEKFPTDQPMPTHPNCRCTMVPVTVSWADYAAINGIPKPPEGWPEGPDLNKLVGDGPSLFDKLSEEDKRKILGHSKYEHYKAGNFGLKDLIGKSTSGNWGKSRHERSLNDLGLSRVPLSTTAEPQKEAQANETEAIRNQIADIQKEAEATRIALTAQVTALEDEYNQLMADYQRLIAKQFNDNLTPAEAAQLEYIKQARQQALQEITTAQAKYDKARGEALERQRALLYVNDPASVRPSGTKNALNRHQDGINGFNKLVSASTVGTVPGFPYQQPTIQSRLTRGRSYYDQRGTVQMSQDSDQVVVHELGHWWEHQNPAAHQATLDFLDRRTAGEVPTWLGPGYGRQEVARPDNFIRPYMGKDYTYRGERYATEIVSMGLEYFYSNPADLAARDPDYFDFIYNLVRGRY